MGMPHITPHPTKINTPHAVYRIIRADGAILYIGCTLDALNRAQQHIYRFKDQVAHIVFEWYPGWLEAARAEAAAILDEKPLFNRYSPHPDSVGLEATRIRPKRGDGLHCPRCGAEKLRRRDAYCPPCARAYTLERKHRLGWEPRPPPTTVCPKCGGPKDPGPAYCRKCGNEYRRLRRHQKGVNRHGKRVYSAPN